MVLSAAFELKLTKDEKYLSVNWLEYFEKPTPEEAVVEIRKALKIKRLANKDGLILALNVGEILNAIRSWHEGVVEILYLDDKIDRSYSGIFGLQEINELAALDMLDLVTEEMTFKAV